MKVEKNQNPSYILGYLLKLIIKIWRFGFFFQSFVNLGHFFHGKNPMYRSKSYFSGQNLAKFRPQKTHLLGRCKKIGYHPKKYLAKSDSEYHSLANQPSILMAKHLKPNIKIW
jgi:hypothetical protein